MAGVWLVCGRVDPDLHTNKVSARAKGFVGFSWAVRTGEGLCMCVGGVWVGRMSLT